MSRPKTTNEQVYAIALGRRVQQARVTRGLTQKQLATAIGEREQQSVSLYELGKQLPILPTAVDLARVLAVTLEWLLGGETPPSQAAGVAVREPESAFLTSRDEWLLLHDALDVGARREVLTFGQRLLPPTPPSSP